MAFLGHLLLDCLSVCLSVYLSVCLSVCLSCTSLLPICFLLFAGALFFILPLIMRDSLSLSLNLLASCHSMMLISPRFSQLMRCYRCVMEPWCRFLVASLNWVWLLESKLIAQTSFLSFSWFSYFYFAVIADISPDIQSVRCSFYAFII